MNFHLSIISIRQSHICHSHLQTWSVASAPERNRICVNGQCQNSISTLEGDAACTSRRLKIYRLINVWLHFKKLVDVSNSLGLFITNLCFPITEGISAMRLFRRSSQRKFGRQSNSSSGNDEIEFPSKYKNWKRQSKANWIKKKKYTSYFNSDKEDPSKTIWSSSTTHLFAVVCDSRRAVLRDDKLPL